MKNHCTIAIEKLLADFQKNAPLIKAPESILDRPILSTTLYLATCQVEMRFGSFTAYVFQDIVHKGYIIALAYGKIKEAKTLYTRVHSSCVTSETLRGCDCDCAQQLEGALQLITEKGHGILFYLMQEGRGVGYIAKARDRMLVQAAEDEISTFEAYHILGLRKDYRQYRNVAPICKMLEIDPEFILLTNNPDKVEALKAFGLNIKKTQPLEFTPSLYNLAYLTSKMESGHHLEKPHDLKSRRIKTPEAVVPFKPHALAQAHRFIKTASYFLPIRPIDDNVFLEEQDFEMLFQGRSIDTLIKSETPLLQGYEPLRKNRYKLRLIPENLKKYAQELPTDPVLELLQMPYWFRVHLYFDIVTDQDFVILSYNTIEKQDVPIVGIQSEALFNRFPLKKNEAQDKFCASIQKIMDYGSGIVVFLHTDGRGSGLAAAAQDMMFTQQGLCAGTLESYKQLGVNYDLRDYQAALILLKQHLEGSSIQMIMDAPASLVNKPEYTAALGQIKINVERWIFLEE